MLVKEYIILYFVKASRIYFIRYSLRYEPFLAKNKCVHIYFSIFCYFLTKLDVFVSLLSSRCIMYYFSNRTVVFVSLNARYVMNYFSTKQGVLMLLNSRYVMCYFSIKIVVFVSLNAR